MLKIGAFTDEISQDFEHALKVMKEYDCTGFELRSAWEAAIQDLTDEQVERIESIARGMGYECYNVAGPVFKCNIDSEEEYKKHLEILDRCVQVAKMLGTDSVRAFTFWRTDEIRLNEWWEKLKELFGPAVDMASGAGMTIAIENEHDTLIGSGVVLRRFISELGADNVKVIWDPCNVVFDYESEPPFPEGYEAVKDLIALVHIKDSVKLGDGKSAKCVPVGDGEAELKELFKALLRDGYTGYMSLETHWRPKGELDHKLMQLPGGKAFSSDAEYASRVCFENLKKLLGEATAEM